MAAGHHHRATTKSHNKPFKSRHATKSSLKARNKGKVEDGPGGIRKNHQMSKLERRNKAKQLQQLKHQELQRETKIFRGRDAAPRIVALVPLCDDCDAPAATRSLLRSLDIHEEIPGTGVFTTWVERFKQRIQWVVVRKEMLAVLDACKVADFVVLMLSANEEVDSFGEGLIRSIEAQGISNVYSVVQHLDPTDKRKGDVQKSLLSFIQHFFPTQQRVYDIESPQDAPNLLRSICTTHPKGVHWRDDRAYVLAEEVSFENDMLVVGGVIRGRGLKADRLIHIQGFGDFQIDKITAHPQQSRPQRSGDDEMMIDGDTSILVTLDTPTSDQDDLLELAPETPENQMDFSDTVSEAPTTASESRKGVLLDDHHYFDDEMDGELTAYEAPKKLPKGTSSYQAAWYLDNEDYGSDEETESLPDVDQDVSMDVDTSRPGARPEDGVEGFAPPPETEYAPTEFGDDAKSVAFNDLSPEHEYEQIRAFRDQRKEIQDEKEFPDEIELEPHVLARERLARYRGLKSLRTSKWDATEDRPWQPESWDRLAKIHNYKTAQRRHINEAAAGGVAAGTRVLIHLRNANPEIAAAFRPEHRPFILWSLLRHEHKQAVCNVSLTASTDYTGDAIKSKDELIIQLGPRRLHINPLFSAPSPSPNNVAKFDRYLFPGRTSIATFVAPLLWGSVPVVCWKRGDNERDWELVGQGSFLGVDRERVVAKRVVLTGHPYKIHKKLVTVRYMFFNTEDVNWFKAVPLYTRRGRSGFVKESLGTHGYFKATFDGKIDAQDAVAISLYKRVFPRGSTEMEE